MRRQAQITELKSPDLGPSAHAELFAIEGRARHDMALHLMIRDGGKEDLAKVLEYLAGKLRQESSNA